MSDLHVRTFPAWPTDQPYPRGMERCALGNLLYLMRREADCGLEIGKQALTRYYRTANERKQP